MSYFLQRDSTFAKKLFSVLFRGIFSQIEKKLSVPEAANVASDINTAVNNMVSSSTKFFPAFISSIQVCYFYSLLLTLVSIVIVNSGSQWKRQNYDCRVLWLGKYIFHTYSPYNAVWDFKTIKVVLFDASLFASNYYLQLFYVFHRTFVTMSTNCR